MLFTHFGVSGPLILTASLAVVDAVRSGAKVTLSIDLKPGMTEQDVHARLQREFEQHAHKLLPNLLEGWVPYKLADVLAELSGVEPDRHVYLIRAEERARIVSLLKDFRWEISGSLPLVSGMVTAGGVKLKEVDPVSFESKIVRGLLHRGRNPRPRSGHRRLQPASRVHQRLPGRLRRRRGRLAGIDRWSIPGSVVGHRDGASRPCDSGRVGAMHSALCQRRLVTRHRGNTGGVPDLCRNASPRAWRMLRRRDNHARGRRDAWVAARSGRRIATEGCSLEVDVASGPSS